MNTTTTTTTTTTTRPWSGSISGADTTLHHLIPLSSPCPQLSLPLQPHAASEAFNKDQSSAIYVAANQILLLDSPTPPLGWPIGGRPDGVEPKGYKSGTEGISPLSASRKDPVVGQTASTATHPIQHSYQYGRLEVPAEEQEKFGCWKHLKPACRAGSRLASYCLSLGPASASQSPTPDLSFEVIKGAVSPISYGHLITEDRALCRRFG